MHCYSIPASVHTQQEEGSEDMVVTIALAAMLLFILILGCGGG